MGLWGRKEACLSVGTQAKDWKEILAIYLPLYFPSVWKRDDVSGRRAQRGYGCNQGGDKQSLGAKDLQNNFWVGTWGPGSTWMGTFWLSEPCWPTVGAQEVPVSWAGSPEGSGAPAMAASEVLMKAMADSGEPTGTMADMAFWVEKQRHGEGCWWWGGCWSQQVLQ